MAQHTGREGTLKIGAATVGELKGWGYDETAETYGTNEATIDTPAPALTFEVGPTSWTGSVDVLWDDSDSGQSAITNGATVAVIFYPEGEASTDVTMTGSAIVTGVGVAGAVDGMATRTFSLQGSGALVAGAVT